ncbi:helix-turn-helix domain-containing protein [Prosthecobacter vanneervenii]|uniref:AraC-like DNA-binding protein n=1 Tax=Prosthecobacter vanneervenii TaxID=48466 RepID=A0A7W8DI84_9BACT|nr:AraC family transcriptional regulator [Prosthecobacter vanneervenii]MBB5030889.1 AraC-like DNA-binding protein [Prosthecobacter vanneervenii]
MPFETVRHKPPQVRHHIEGVRSADLPACGLEVLMHRKISLKRWTLAAAADAYWRLYRPLSAGGVICFDGTEHPMKPGRLYLISPHTRFDSRAERAFSKWYIHFTLHSARNQPAPFVAELKADTRMKVLLQVLCPAQSKTGRRQAEPGPWLMLELLALALEQAAPLMENRPSHDVRLEHVHARMQRELAEKLTLADLSRTSGLSVRHLNSLFVEQTGLPPMRYLTELRLNQCQLLLRQTQLSIDDIAEQCGFANRFYLTRMMSRHRHTTPGAFRRQIAAGR